MGTGTIDAGRVRTALRFRRNADRLTAGQLAALSDAFTRAQALSDDRGYGFYAGIHGLPLPIGCDNAHGTPYFLPWHRAYLYFFERALRDRNRDAMLTWWDWRTPPGTAGALPRPFAARGSRRAPNPLLSAAVDPLARRQGRGFGDPRVAAATRTFRRPGTLGVPLPSAAQVTAALSAGDFLDFSEAVEGLHNDVHVWVGGHMSEVPFAAFDPIFWAHHTMIDRLWRLWQLRNPGGRPPASILDEALPPFRMTVRQTLDVTALGYDYAVSTASAVVVR
ncbi:tyrosinase family protein [Conexibacter stalactiti]|uniref:Tyrosinase family protein n=1 Tax=Conexibacter stalactiti TaxID=1940611 RepID=A0ABU4HHD3_9ACTN|nr:tyrosinase family protein [Conexibacter stalactiti]MDW5592713.1 tyrosinase family protein [Conexibacter stalactiti]MEC5033354.1 tyrosinase family protein [Conexibacter stalactiti]